MKIWWLIFDEFLMQMLLCNHVIGIINPFTVELESEQLAIFTERIKFYSFFFWVNVFVCITNKLRVMNNLASYTSFIYSWLSSLFETWCFSCLSSLRTLAHFRFLLLWSYSIDSMSSIWCYFLYNIDAVLLIYTAAIWGHTTRNGFALLHSSIIQMRSDVD